MDNREKHFNQNKLEKEIAIDENYIVTHLKFVPDKKTQGFYRLNDQLMSQLNTESENRSSFKFPETIQKFYPKIEIEKLDKITRPKGDTTLFTLGGIQHIETLIREKGNLEKKVFAIAQPSLRSQYMDKVEDGTSTAFISISIESIDTTPIEFIEACKNFIALMVGVGMDTNYMKFNIEDISDTWNDKELSQKAITIYYKNFEVGECVYIPDYPFIKDQKISVSDLSFSIERLHWALNKEDNYFFSDMKETYLENIDGVSSDKITSIIDCIRSAVLIASEGVKPAHKDPGFRLRQLIKRFVQRNQSVKIDINKLISLSYKYWEKWNHKSELSLEEITQLLVSEQDRSFNVFVLQELQKEIGKRIQMNVNQSTEDFIKQVNSSFSEENKKIMTEIINKYK